MAPQVKPIPACFHTLTPMLTVREAAKAIDVYKRALGAEERLRITLPDGKGIMHAQLSIGDSVIMLAEERPQQGCGGPQTLGGTPVSFYLFVEDADKAVQRAVAAGATVAMPVADMFWGDRGGQVVDPFGHRWFLATHREDVPKEELQKRADQFCAQAAKEASRS